MSANRAVAAVGVAAAVVTGVLIPVLDVIKNDIAKAIFLGVLALCVTAIIIIWLLGWQKYEGRKSPAGELRASK